MPTNSATLPTLPLRVAFVLFPGTKLLDVTGPLQVFADARNLDRRPAYETILVSIEGGPIVTDTGIPLPTITFNEATAGPIDTLLVSGGRSALTALKSDPLLRALQDCRSMTRRFGSICLGAFIVAEGGHLDNRRATTHWGDCEAFALAYPQVTLDCNAIFINDGTLWTSAGVSAGIDMALAMVEEDLGRAEALRLARVLVLYLRRPGGQSQFSAPLQGQIASANGRFDKLCYYIREHLEEELNVSCLAAISGMSDRTFARVFAKIMGTTPARYVESLRVEATCLALCEEDLPIKVAARKFGFESEERMRRAFQRQIGVAPTEYRNRFR